MRDLRAASAAAIAGTHLSVTLDGAPFRNLKRIKSPVFQIALPADNVFDAPCGSDVPKHIYSTAVDDGYYLTIESLPRGDHTLEFKVTDASGALLQHVTYLLKIGPLSGQ